MHSLLILFLAYAIHIALVQSQRVNETYVAKSSNIYDTYCDLDWPGNDLIYYNSILDLPGCIEKCETWNEESDLTSGVCVGVAVVQSGSSNLGCYLKTIMVGPGTRNIMVVDCARRRKSVTV